MSLPAFAMRPETSPTGRNAAGRLSVKVTGAVNSTPPPPETLAAKGVLAISRFSYHWVQGSPLPREV